MTDSTVASSATADQSQAEQRGAEPAPSKSLEDSTQAAMASIKRLRALTASTVASSDAPPTLDSGVAGDDERSVGARADGGGADDIRSNDNGGDGDGDGGDLLDRLRLLQGMISTEGGSSDDEDFSFNTITWDGSSSDSDGDSPAAWSTDRSELPGK